MVSKGPSFLRVMNMINNISNGISRHLWRVHEFGVGLPIRGHVLVGAVRAHDNQENEHLRR